MALVVVLPCSAPEASAQVLLPPEPTAIDPEVLPTQSLASAPFPVPEATAVAGNSLDRFLIAHPTHANEFWTPTWGSGVWKTTDGGRTWHPKSRGLVNLMVDAVRIDPIDPTLMYAAQSPLGGAGNGYLYRSTDGGESWDEAGVCQHWFAPKTNFAGMDIGPARSAGSYLWATQTLDQQDCGLIFRTENQGASWCSYSPNCSTQVLGSQICPGSLGDLTGQNLNDGGNAIAIAASADSLDPDEVYFFHSKYTAGLPCRNTFRTTSFDSGLSWLLRDRWAGSTQMTSSCNIGAPMAIDRMRHLGFAYDPDHTDRRIGEYKLFNALPNPGDLLDLRLGWHDGLVVGGDRQWSQAVDLKSCFAIPTSSASAGFGPVEFKREGTRAEFFGLVRHFGLEFALLHCDASSSFDDCKVESGWECIWNSTNATKGGQAGCTVGCPAGAKHWTNHLWQRLAVSSNLGAGGRHDVLLTARKVEARMALLRVAHDGSGWQPEEPVDPVTCTPSGPELLTPLDMVETVSGRLIAGAPRHVFRKEPSGGWQALPPHGFYDAGPILRQSASNADALYALTSSGMFRSANGGTSFHRVEDISLKEGFGGCLPHFYQTTGDSCVDECWDQTVADAPSCVDNPAIGFYCCYQAEFDLCNPLLRIGSCGHAGHCGRIDRVCGSINDFVVDRDDDARVIAASERGIWRWEYPFVNSLGSCYPAIPFDKLTTQAAALAGEKWVGIQTCPPPTGPCVMDMYFLTIAQDPANGQHLLAGGRHEGLLESLDRGATWSFALAGIPLDTAIHDLLFLATGDVLVATEAGVFKRVGPAPTPFLKVLDRPARDLAIHVDGGVTHAYAAAMDWDESTWDEGVYHSADAGNTWAKIVSTADNQRVMSVFVDSGGRVYFGLLGGGLHSLGDPLSTVWPNCPRFQGLEVPGSGPGALHGTAVSGVDDVPDPIGGQKNCASDWAALEFQTSPLEARVRVYQEDRTMPRLPINPNVPLASARGSLQGVGDRDGDGCPEIAVGLPAPATGAGLVKVISACTRVPILPVGTLQPGALNFGTAMAGSGDYLAVGAPATTGGVAYVYNLANLSLPPVVVGAPAGAGQFGWSLAFGDVNGDGAQDLVVGAPDLDVNGSITGPGKAYVFNGALGWLPPAMRTLLPTGPFQLSGFGMAVASGYDRRGLGGPTADGSDDIVVGAPGENGTGTVHYYANVAEPDPGGLVLSGENAGDWFGWSVLLTRDATGDVAPDLLVGAPNHNDGTGNAKGAVYLYEGASPYSCKLVGTVPNGQLGRSLAEAGETSFNHTTDLLIGQPDPSGATPGSVFLVNVLR